MFKLTPISILVISSLAFGQTPTTKDLSELGKVDPKLVEKINNKVKVADKKNKAKIGFACKSSTGKIYNQNDVGFNECTTELKKAHDSLQLNSQKEISTNGPAGSASFNLKFGE